MLSPMQVKARITSALRGVRRKLALRGIRQIWGTSSMKRRLWDNEYASGKWDHCDHTPGAWVYGFVQKHCRNGSILDLGCGAGNTGNELDANSYQDYTGVDVSEVAVRKAAERSERNGRTNKNRYIQSDIVSYVPKEKHNVILFRESIYNIPQPKMKATLDLYSRYLADDGVFVVYVSRDGTKKVREIVEWLEANYSVTEKHLRTTPPDAFVVVFR